jgi:mitochondrial import inner membrane translocase subunit TIM16
MLIAIQHYEHLFKVNSPPTAPPKAPAAGKKPVPPPYSHYLQSKIVRARQRIEAEAAGEAAPAQAQPEKAPPPPPAEQGKPSP